MNGHDEENRCFSQLQECTLTHATNQCHFYYCSKFSNSFHSILTWIKQEYRINTNYPLMLQHTSGKII